MSNRYIIIRSHYKRDRNSACYAAIMHTTRNPAPFSRQEPHSSRLYSHPLTTEACSIVHSCPRSFSNDRRVVYIQLSHQGEILVRVWFARFSTGLGFGSPERRDSDQRQIISSSIVHSKEIRRRNEPVR